MNNNDKAALTVLRELVSLCEESERIREEIHAESQAFLETPFQTVESLHAFHEEKHRLRVHMIKRLNRRHSCLLELAKAWAAGEDIVAKRLSIGEKE